MITTLANELSPPGERHVPDGWRDWLQTMFPDTFKAGFADHHVEYWDWLQTIEDGVAPADPAFGAFWPRGGGKTTSAETGVIMLGALGKRKFCLYVRATQEKANESIASIAQKLEGATISEYYPTLASRSVNKYGQSKGWSATILRCANGFSVLGLGLDAVSRGVKFDDYRPDIIVLDDVDAKHDSAKLVKKKIDTITTSILPAGATHVAVLFMQNLIHVNSIANSIVEGTAEFLYNIRISGPHKAIKGLTYERRPYPERGYNVTGGEPVWQGQTLKIAEGQINLWGLSSFLKESQHEIEEKGGIWDHVEFIHVRPDRVPDYVQGQVWVDPAVTATDDSDCQGIAAGALGEDNLIYVCHSWEGITTPLDAIKRAILTAIRFRFRIVGIETNQGGDTWKSVYYVAWREILDDDTIEHIISLDAAILAGITVNGNKLEEKDREVYKGNGAFVYYDDTGEWEWVKRPLMKSAKAGAGTGNKVHRNQQMLVDYETGNVVHVTGTHNVAERALRRFPNKPLDYADALYWLWLRLSRARRGSHIG